MTVLEAENLVHGLHSLFDIARLVDPETHHVINLHSGEKIPQKYPCCCYDIWNRDTVCEQCVFADAAAGGKRRECVEIHNGTAYHVICAPMEVEGRMYALECISRTDDKAVTEANGETAEAYTAGNDSQYIDPLTGVYNFRYYQDVVVSLAGEQAAALLEIDDLIGIRAEFGDAGADLFMQRAISLIRSYVRDNDVIIRSENDSFLLLFRLISKEAFFSRMERIRRAVGTLFLPEFPGRHITLSIGGVFSGSESPVSLELLKARLDQAKKKGNAFFCPHQVQPAEKADYSEKEKEILSFSSDFHSIFTVDLATGHMETVQAEGENEQWIRETARTDYDTYRKVFTEKFILPEDRDWFLRETEKEVVLAQLEQDEAYYINHRILKHGAEYYYQTKFTHDPRSDRPERILLGGHSVDAQTRRSLRKSESEQRQEKALRDCIRVLYSRSDIHEAICMLLKEVTGYYGAERAYICEIDREGQFNLNSYRFYAPGVEHADLNDLVEFDKLCFDSWADAFRNEGQLLIEVPQIKEACEPAHRLMQANGVERMIMAPVFSGNEISGFLGIDNPMVNYHDLFLLRSVAAFTYSELLRRNQEERKSSEQLAVIAGLAANYVHVAIADLRKNRVTVFRMSEELSGEMDGWESITDFKYKLQMFLDRMVVPEDRESLAQFMREENITRELRNKPAIYKNYSVFMGGQRVAFQTKIVRCEKDGEDCILIGVKSVEEERRRERQAREQLEITVAERTMELQERNRLLNRLNEDVIEFLGRLTEARDKESGEHINRVKGFTYILASSVMENFPEYGLDREKVEIIASASALHDLGKIMIPDSVLLKPGRLSESEFAVMKTHCVHGAEILKHAPRGWSGEYLKTSLDIVLCHHEKVDGRGYPGGLVGDEIPISAQIVSVADCYDALTTKRVYKEAYSPDTAFEMILGGQCGAFSEKILFCFKECREKFEKYYRGELNAQMDVNVLRHSMESLTGLCILVVEDNDVSRSVIQDILECEGAFVLSAIDGQDALHILLSERRRIDAVLTDISMPNLDGPGLAAAIRTMENERIRNIPILALTGFSDDETEKRCMRSGMDAFLTKPISISGLTRKLLACLSKRSEELLQDSVNTIKRPVGPNPVPEALLMGDYTDMVQKLSEKLLNGEAQSFAMLDADVNDLKKVNRLYGHETGDRYLQSCCMLLKEIFPESGVYRIGGDEFAVILLGSDYERREEKIELLRQKTESAGPLPDGLDGRVSFAFGMAAFDREHDMTVSAVFSRAEKAMREHKNSFKKK